MVYKTHCLIDKDFKCEHFIFLKSPKSAEKITRVMSNPRKRTSTSDILVINKKIFLFFRFNSSQIQFVNNNKKKTHKKNQTTTSTEVECTHT